MGSIIEEFAVPCPKCGELLEKFITPRMVWLSLYCPVNVCDEFVATCCVCDTRVAYIRNRPRLGKLTARQYVARYFRREVEDPE